MKLSNILASFVFAISASAYAQTPPPAGTPPPAPAQPTETQPAPPAPQPMHTAQMHRKIFFLGVCVGQTLAKSGIYLPEMHPGHHMDPTLHAAIKAARQSCHRMMFHRGEMEEISGQQ